MIKFGLIGPGSIARKFAQDIKHSHNSKLIAVASRNEQRAKDFSSEFDIKYTFSSYQELANFQEIDAVYISTPHNFHKDQAILCMEQGLHVLVEKPISINKNELEEMIKVAQDNNVLIMEAMWTRFLPGTQRVKEIIESKELGELKELDLSFGFKLPDDYPSDGRILNPNLAGGSILDLGIYPVSITNYFTDNAPIKDLNVDAILTDQNIDIDCKISIAFENGVKANLHSSFKDDLDIVGYLKFTNGEIKMPVFWHCQKLYVNDEEIHFPTIADGFTEQINAFSDTIIKGLTENPIMSYENMLKVIELLDSIREQAKVKYPNEK